MSHRLLALYPRAWRDRYGDEVAYLVEKLVTTGETTPRRAALDLAAGAVVQRWRAVVRHRVLVPVAVALTILIGLATVSLAVSYAVRGRAQPYFGAHLVGLLLVCVEVLWLALEVVAFVSGPRPGEWPVGARAWTAVGACLVGATVAITLAPAAVPKAAVHPGGVAFVVGMVILSAGVGLRWWSLRVDVDATKPAGPYRLLRHPQRAGVLVATAGIGMASANWVGLAIMMVLPLALLVWRVRLAENALAADLGERYRDYAGERKRLVPLIW